MGFIFSKFSKLGRGQPPNPSPSVAEANQLFEATHSFWAGYATALLNQQTNIGRNPILEKRHREERTCPSETTRSSPESCHFFSLATPTATRGFKRESGTSSNNIDANQCYPEVGIPPRKDNRVTAWDVQMQQMQ